MGVRPLFVVAATAVVGTFSTLALSTIGADASMASANAPQTVEVFVDPAMIAPAEAAPVQADVPVEPNPETNPIPVPPVEPVAPVEPKKNDVAVTNDAETVCLAKIVHHESANQPREGQVAVAQVVMNRTKDRRFAKTLCGVAMQKGQFFNVHAYNPSGDKRWSKSLEIARNVRAGKEASVVGNATFFQAVWADGAFFRTLKFVKRIHGHNFYALKG
jgi:N-acetylmuramoyl-L-alanine amidase